VSRRAAGGRIAYLTWGNGSQIRSFQDFAAWLDDMIYLDDLPGRDLGAYAAVVVPDAMNGERLARHAAALNDYVRTGGFLIVFACNGVEDWIDAVELIWRPVGIKDWLWWTRPGARPEIHQPEPRHPICAVIPERDMAWHWKGVFDPHPRGRSILNLDDDSASLFLDFQDLPGGGRLMVTTLDPHVHHGERFMPATTRFLEAFYPWLNRELGIDRGAAGFRVTYVQCHDSSTEWRPESLESAFDRTGGEVRFVPLYELAEADLAATDVLYIPNNQDQFRLRRIQDLLLGYLARGGHMLINSEPAISWLPFLGRFEPVPPKPFTNFKMRIRDDRFGFFRNMADGFDGWCGVFGQYARGWSPMPDGAVWLTEVGPPEDPKPADWLWQYPTDDGKGGHVFMHNGDNLIRYPDHGPHRFRLVRDVCRGLVGLGRPPSCDVADDAVAEGPGGGDHRPRWTIQVR
jgi:hypothetical protein